MKPFKIQNRSQTSRRVKFIKNGGLIQFTKDPIASFVENSREAGFCLNPIEPLPLMVDALGSIDLTAHPMGTDGRVSLFVEGELTQSVRYSNLNRLADRQTWFNQEFGTVINYTGREIAVFESLTPEVTYRLVFEDDDLDYEFGEFGLEPSSLNPTLVVEQYRLAFDLKLADNKFKTICASSTVTSPFILTGDGEFNFSINGEAISETPLTIDSSADLLNSKGISTTIVDLLEPVVYKLTVVDINNDYGDFRLYNNAAPNNTPTYIDWGDGTLSRENVRTWNSYTGFYHEYAEPGDYTVRIFYSPYNTSVEIYSLTEFVSWGDPEYPIEISLSAPSEFTVPTTLPATVTSLRRLFYGAIAFNQDISGWDTSNITDMSQTFYAANAFNQPIGTWDTTNVTDFHGMFGDATAFNGNIGSWNTSNVTSMYEMFQRAINFNQDISGWDTSKVTLLSSMFSLTEAFNQDISSWDVSNVNRMDWMFNQAVAFNQPLNAWTLAPRVDITGMFANATTFNQPLNEWDVSGVGNMQSLFANAAAFNQDLNSWNVINVADMRYMFNGATAYDHAITQWCVPTFAVLPYNFAVGAPLFTTDKHPVWGTCPLTEQTNALFDETLMWTQSDYGTYYQGNAGDVIYYNDGTSLNVTSDGTYYSLKSLAGTHRVVLNKTRFRDYILLTGYGLTNILSFPKIPTVKQLRLNMNGENAPKRLVSVPDYLPPNITSLAGMFVWTEIFNQDISGWNTENVTDMSGMFNYAQDFNQPIGTWNTSNVTNMQNMFRNAADFNQPLTNWNTSKVTVMSYMFNNASQFNGSVAGWDTSSVTTMAQMFNWSRAFNSDVSLWNTANVTDMNNMFYGCEFFNQDLSGWDVSNVTTMQSMFASCAKFNSNLSGWNVTKVTTMQSMFDYAMAFNGNVTTWDVSNNINFESMFNEARAFNQDISGWNTKNATKMSYMLYSAQNFNQNLSQWCTPKILSNPTAFSGGVATTFSGKYATHYPVWGTCPRGENLV